MRGILTRGLLVILRIGKLLLPIIVRIAFYALIYVWISSAMNKPAFPRITAFVDLLQNGFLSKFCQNALPSIIRWSVILLVGSAAGVIVGITVGYVKSIYKLTNFEIDFLRSIPATTIVTFVFVAFSDNEVSRNIPVFYITFFTIVFYVSSHIYILDRTRINHLKDLGASFRFIMFNCLVFESLPIILIAIRQAVSLSFLVLVSIELIVGSSNNLGLGVMLYDYKEYLNYKEIIITILLLGGMGYIANYAFHALNRRLIFWERGTNADSQ